MTRKETLIRFLVVLALCISSGACAGGNFSKYQLAQSLDTWESAPAYFYRANVVEEIEYEEGRQAGYYWVEAEYVYVVGDALFRSELVYPEPFFSDNFTLVQGQLGAFSPLKNGVWVNPKNELQSVLIPKFLDKHTSLWVSGLWTLGILAASFFLLGLKPQVGAPIVLTLVLLGFMYSYQGPKDTSTAELASGGQAAFEQLLESRSEELKVDLAIWQEAKGRNIADLWAHFGEEKLKRSGNGLESYHFQRQYWPKAMIATVNDAEGTISETTEFFKF